nr:hypothetical protein [Tanacetum cinerariifolium]
MSTQQDIYAAGSENRPPMLNKENYVPWSSRLLRYVKSRPNGKLIHNFIINGPYVRRMIPEPDDPNLKVHVNETFHVQTDDELTEKELKQMEADDQAIQTILLGRPEDIYAVVDSCETAQEIWLHVQQMMKGSDIGIQEKKAKMESTCYHCSSNKGLAYSRLHSIDIYAAGSESRPPMLNKENYVPWSSRLLRYAKSRPNRKLIHNSILNGPYVRRIIPEPGDTNREVPMNETFHVQTDDELTEKEHKQIEVDDQAIHNILLGLPEDIYATVDSCETAQENLLRVQQMMKGFDIGIQEKKSKNQVAQYAIQNLRVQNVGNQNGLIGVPGNANQNLNENGNLVAACAEGNQASTSGTQTDKAPVYDSDGSAGVQNYENCYNNEIFNIFTQEEQYIELLEPIPESHQEKYDKLERCYQKSVYQEQCLSKKISALHLSFEKQIMTLNEEISDLNQQLSVEKSTVSSLLEEKKRLKSDFKICEDELLDKQIQLEKKIKELDIVLIKTGQSIQTIHMLSPNPDSFYHTEQKITLGYQNPFYLKQAQQKQQSLYDGNVLFEKHDPRVVHDSKETLQLAQENTRNPLSQKLKNENVELEFQVLNYAKENAHLKITYKNLFDSNSVSRTQTKTIIASLQNQLHNSIYKNANLRARLFNKVSDQKDNKCGMSANTKFAKQSIMGNLPKVIALGIFRINPFKTSREEKHVPNTVKASARIKPITVSQPPVFTKKDVNSDSNGLSSIGVDNPKTRRPQPRRNTKNDRVSYASKSSRSKNKEVEVEEHHRNLLLS